MINFDACVKINYVLGLNWGYHYARALLQ